jgi:uncharacterized membrane protein
MDEFEDRTDRDRSDTSVIVSKLQVAFQVHGNEQGIQRSLSGMTLRGTMAPGESLFCLLQRVADVLRDNEDAWTHVAASSQRVGSPEDAEIVFNRLSWEEREKLTLETSVSAQDGDRQQLTEPSTYLVVSLLLITADDQPLFGEMYSASVLRDVLQELVIMPDRTLLALDILWNPQNSLDRLTEVELTTHYAELVAIA